MHKPCAGNWVDVLQKCLQNAWPQRDEVKKGCEL